MFCCHGYHRAVQLQVSEKTHPHFKQTPHTSLRWYREFTDSHTTQREHFKTCWNIIHQWSKKTRGCTPFWVFLTGWGTFQNPSALSSLTTGMDKLWLPYKMNSYWTAHGFRSSRLKHQDNQLRSHATATTIMHVHHRQRMWLKLHGPVGQGRWENILFRNTPELSIWD